MATKPRHRKTAIQLWVADNRKDGGHTSKDLADWAGVTTDTARGWESRGRPSEDAIRILERKFGKPAPDGDDSALGDQSDLAAAISAHADSTKALADQVKALVEAQMSPTELAQMMGEAIRLAVREALQAAAPDGVTQRS